MHNVLRLILFTAIFTSVIYGQGGGGGSRGGSRSRIGRSHYYPGRRTCTGDNCQNETTTVGYIIIGGVIVIFCMAVYHTLSNGSPMRTNPDYINLPSAEIELPDSDQFVSGVWSSRYYQYGIWHGPYQFSLVFDPETSQVTGNGWDDVGEYTVQGLYSRRTNRMGLIKGYRKGTGNRTQNLGHNVTIQLAWKSSEQLFEGRWFVKTSKYSGDDKFELKLEKSSSAMD